MSQISEGLPKNIHLRTDRDCMVVTEARRHDDFRPGSDMCAGLPTYLTTHMPVDFASFSTLADQSKFQFRDG